MVLFPPPFYFVFYISNLLSYIQNNFSYELARPIMGTIFLVCIYIVRAIRANFVLITRKEGGAYFEIAARTLCLHVCGATPRFTAAVKIPLPRQHFSSRILFDRKLSESYFF